MYKYGSLKEAFDSLISTLNMYHQHKNQCLKENCFQCAQLAQAVMHVEAERNRMVFEWLDKRKAQNVE
jgi:hypothetical protein